MDNSQPALTVYWSVSTPETSPPQTAKQNWTPAVFSMMPMGMRGGLWWPALGVPVHTSMSLA